MAYKRIVYRPAMASTCVGRVVSSMKWTRPASWSSNWPRSCVAEM